MNYLSYIQGIFTDYTVTEEINYQYDGDNTVIVISYLGGGTNFADSKVQPVQLSAYTKDIPTVQAEMISFAQNYTNVGVWENLEYIKQSYQTPLVITKMQGIGTNFTHRIIVNGTLIISDNISDIQTVEIDGFEYETVSRDLTYNTLEDTQRKDNVYISETDILKSIVQFTVAFENKNNDVCTKASRIRQGTLDPNTDFTIKLTFTDNDREESYTMKLHSSVLNSRNILTPAMTLTFIK